MNEIIEHIIDFFKDIFLLRYLPVLNDDTGYVVIFIFGFLTSFHCIAMCGGFTLSQIVGEETEIFQKVKRCFIYNLFRVISYSIAGAIVGTLGTILCIPGKMQGIVPIIGGIFMIVISINLLGLFKKLRIVNLKVPPVILKLISNNKSNSAVFLGIVSVFMPCAPLQIVQLYALGTKSPIQGFLSMMIFSLGTVPILLLFGVANSTIAQKYAKQIIKISAVLVMILGVSIINRGLMYFNISVENPYDKYEEEEVFTSTIEGNIQILVTDLEKDKYPKIKVHKNIPVKWTINVKEENLNECNNEIEIRTFNISKKLEVGENIIEFTPYEEGCITYTCWMNMIKSSIEVIS